MTPYNKVFDSFLDLIIRDTTFFIKNPDVNIVKAVSQERMIKLLNHAITNMMLVKDKRNFEINFMNIRDDINLQFTEELTPIEIDILAYYMFQCYVDEEVVVRLKKLKELGFSDDEIKTFSPANSLKEFNATFATLKYNNEDKVKEYKRRSRKDFLLKSHNFIFEK